MEVIIENRSGRTSDGYHIDAAGVITPLHEKYVSATEITSRVEKTEFFHSEIVKDGFQPVTNCRWFKV